MGEKKLISFIVPIYNEEKNINSFYQTFRSALATLTDDFDYELIFVNDGSVDGSDRVIEELAGVDNRVRYLEFSRNFGKESATTAGLHDARGLAAIMIDADLQHPPALIPDMIAKWQNGAEVVVAVRNTNQGAGLLKKVGSSLFYKIINRIADIKITPRATDFRLLDRAVIDEFNRFTENNRMTRALIDWLGFKRDYLYFDAGKRLDGEARYGFWKLVKLAVSSFVSLSLLPLKLAGYLGMLIVLCAGVLGLYILFGKYIFHWPLASGFSGPAQLAILIVFLVGVILASLGLMALYVANIHGEVSRRPLYVIRKRKKYD